MKLTLHWLFAGLFASLAFSAVSLAQADERDACLMGLAPALIEGGFSGSVDCAKDNLKLTRVGQIEGRSKSFTVYTMVYQLKRACPKCAVHGGQRIIFMSEGRYIGQYRSDFAEVTIKNNALEFNIPGQEPTVARIEGSDPPTEIYDGADILQFFK